MSRRRPPAPAGFAHSSFGASGFGPSEYPGFAPQRISPGRARRRRSARAPWSWVIAGALLGLIFTLAWQAPARWLAAGLRQASGGLKVVRQPNFFVNIESLSDYPETGACFLENDFVSYVKRRG